MKPNKVLFCKYSFTFLALTMHKRLCTVMDLLKYIEPSLFALLIFARLYNHSSLTTKLRTRNPYYYIYRQIHMVISNKFDFVLEPKSALVTDPA